VLIAAALFHHAAEARDPAFAIESPGAEHRIRQPGPPQDRGLRAVKLFAAQLRRIDGVRIDQHDIVARPRQHGGSG
jgi:hypothetical protein